MLSIALVKIYLFLFNNHLIFKELPESPEANTDPQYLLLDTLPSTALSPHWWSRGGSNSRPSACKADALPAELRPPIRLLGGSEWT